MGDGQQFLGGYELVEELGLVWHRAQAAADVELKAALFLAVDGLDHGDAAEVVHVGQAAGFVLAAGEGDLELAPEVLAVGMPEQEAHEGLGIGRYVKGFRAADAGEGASGDVAH